jgi:hypothetical protein
MEDAVLSIRERCFLSVIMRCCYVSQGEELCGRSGRCAVLFVKEKCCPVSQGGVLSVLSAGRVAVLSGRDAVLFLVRVR